jgi:hypothetical protein
MRIGGREDLQWPKRLDFIVWAEHTSPSFRVKKAPPSSHARRRESPWPAGCAVPCAPCLSCAEKLRHGRRSPCTGASCRYHHTRACQIRNPRPETRKKLEIRSPKEGVAQRAGSFRGEQPFGFRVSEFLQASGLGFRIFGQTELVVLTGCTPPAHSHRNMSLCKTPPVLRSASC